MTAKITGIVLTKNGNNLLEIKRNLSFCDQVLVFENSVINDFSKVRNKIMERSRNDWILFLDDDEKLSKDLILEIATLDLNTTSFSGFYIPRKNYFIDRYVGDDLITRLARKSKGLWKRAVHETWDVKGNLGQLSNPIIHNTSDSVSKMIDKINYYSDIHAKENLNEGKISSVLKIILFPVFKFFESLFKGRGFVFSLLQSFHSFLAWSKLWILQKD